MATPSRVKPLSPYFFWKPIIHGISTRQGSHQVAQKFTTTTFPFRPARGTSCPSRFLKVTTGSFGFVSLEAADLLLAAPELHAEKLVVTVNMSINSSKKRFGARLIFSAPINVKIGSRMSVYPKAISDGS